MSFNWTCPICDRDTIIIDDSYIERYAHLDIDSAQGYRTLAYRFIVCPNPRCRKISLYVSLFKRQYRSNSSSLTFIKSWQLIPPSKAKQFPDCGIPKAVLKDYSEACLILNDSPKASATISRRCLQGMIRHRWKVKGDNLHQEINKIKDKVEPEIWDAIDGVRKIGNIGAHMEKDVNLIINVEPDEAEKLIKLIEMLLKDWYVNRKARQDLLKDITQITDKKDKEKKKGKKKQNADPPQT